MAGIGTMQAPDGSTITLYHQQNRGGDGTTAHSTSGAQPSLGNDTISKKPDSAPGGISLQDVWNAAAGDDINTIGDPNAPLWHKGLAGIDLASSLIDPLKGAGETAAKIAVSEGAEAVAKRIAKTTGIDAAKDASHKAYLDGLRAAMQKPIVSDPILQNLVNKIYRQGASIGSGSTAAAVREELQTGSKIGGKFHSQKAAELTGSLQKWLENNPTAKSGDRAAAENIIQDMRNALNGK